MNWSASNAEEIELRGFTVQHPISPPTVQAAQAIINEDFARNPPTDDDWKRMSGSTFCANIIYQLRFPIGTPSSRAMPSAKDVCALPVKIRNSSFNFASGELYGHRVITQCGMQLFLPVK